jgi:hypothetical protein
MQVSAMRKFPRFGDRQASVSGAMRGRAPVRRPIRDFTECGKILRQARKLAG